MAAWVEATSSRARRTPRARCRTTATATTCCNEPDRDCARCPRLAAFRAQNRVAFPDFHNAPVPSEGGVCARILVVGLAPALKGGNRSGLPFRGDASGRWLRAALDRHGLGEDMVRITNAVRCVPPANKPTSAEVAACRPFLVGELSGPELRVALALGRVAHDAVFGALGLRGAAFGHGAVHALGRLTLVDSYHPSPQNTNTGRLTPAMFDAVFKTLKDLL